MSSHHVDTIKDLYATFGRGDIPGVLGRLAEDIEWEYGAASNDVPWLQHRRGREAAAGFFEATGLFDLAVFRPKTFLADGDVVVVLIDVELVVKATGRRITEENEVHIWHFDNAGRPCRFAHKLDSHRHWLEYHGNSAASPAPPRGMFADA